MTTNHLAKELGKYYRRERNKFVFVNGMTLNKLAWEMWERLDYKEVDPSVLSRVINGERLLTFDQLLTFIEILGISQKNKRLLMEAFFLDLSKRFSIPGVRVIMEK